MLTRQQTCSLVRVRVVNRARTSTRLTLNHTSISWEIYAAAYSQSQFYFEYFVDLSHARCLDGGATFALIPIDCKVNLRTVLINERLSGRGNRQAEMAYDELIQIVDNR